MATILMPVSNIDFDPSETGVPWQILRMAGHSVVLATPDGRPGQADPRMLTGEGLGVLAQMLMADSNAREAYRQFEQSKEFHNPIAFADIRTADFDGLLLPGGHAPGVKPYLDSECLQARVVEFFQQQKPVGAICHGVLVAARARTDSGHSVLFGKKSTGLIKRMELSAWAVTYPWRRNYYRTYPQTVEDEMKGILAQPSDFLRGPLGLVRDSLTNLAPGFTVLDGNYLSARWPGDVHRFSIQFAKLLANNSTKEFERKHQAEINSQCP